MTDGDFPDSVPPWLVKYAREMWADRLADPVQGPILKRDLADPYMQALYELFEVEHKRGQQFLIQAEPSKIDLAIPAWADSWLVKFVRLTMAKELADPLKGPILKRLLTDPRMKPFHESDNLPRRAKFWIVRQALFYAVEHKPKVVYQAKVDAEREEKRDVARKLRDYVDDYRYDAGLADVAARGSRLLSALGEPPLHSDGRSIGLGALKVLGVAADIVERMASETRTRRTVIERDRGDSEACALAMAIATQFDLFCSHASFSLTARVVSAALDLKVDITWERVRDWWERHRGLGRARKKKKARKEERE
jgi:hypothetical protein